MRSILFAGAAIAALAGISGEAVAQTEVKVALIAPLSGPYGRQGQLMQFGAEQAIEQINRDGGIKALNGAKLKLVTADAGDSIERARNAAQRLVAQEPDIVAGTGAWLSSFSLAVTEVTERAEIAWLTLSYSDQITARGFKYVFQMSPSAGTQAKEAIPTIIKLAQEQTGRLPTTVGIIQDNTALAVSFTKQMREGGLQAAKLNLTVDETFTPPLSDASSLVQKLRSARPEFLVLLPSNVPDTKLLIEKMAEFGLGKGRIPAISSGGQTGAPELLNVVGKENLEGFMGIVANWPAKRHRGNSRRFQGAFERTLDDPGYDHDLCGHVRDQGGSRSRRLHGSQETSARRCARSISRTASPGLPRRRPHPLRSSGPSDRCSACDSPVAKRRAGNGVPGRYCRRQACLAEAVASIS